MFVLEINRSINNLRPTAI